MLISAPIPAPDSAIDPPSNGKITLTHHDRVLLAAERMHAAGIRARPHDTLPTQLRIAAFGEYDLNSPRQDLACRWRLAAFGDRRCRLKVQAAGPWSPKAARIVVAEFGRFAGTLCPAIAGRVASMVHNVRPGETKERSADGYHICVALREQSTDNGSPETSLLIEFWPTQDETPNSTATRQPARK